MFTSLAEPHVEAFINRQMQVIVGEISRTYGSDCTIILAGSFGRGEGSVRLEGGKNPVPLNDYDVYVITDKRVEASVHLRMEERILQELSELTESDLARDKFVVGVEVVPRRSLARLLPDISTYEMKTASRVLYGPDLRRLIPVSAEDIPLASGAITLFHRTIALLENVEPEYLSSKNYPIQKRLETVRETCKVYTEICTSLSLIGGFYKPSYRARAQEFASHYDRFPELARTIRDLPFKVATRTEMKISSDFSSIIDDAPRQWLEARRDLDVCQRYFLSRMLDVRFEQAWEGFASETEKRMRWIFFYDYLSFLLKQRGIHGMPLIYGANIAFQVYDSYSFNRRLNRFGRTPADGPFSLSSPLAKIYLATAATLYSLQDDGSIDEGLLRVGWRYLEKIFRLPKPKAMDAAEWKKAREYCLDAQKLYFVREQKRGL